MALGALVEYDRILRANDAVAAVAEDDTGEVRWEILSTFSEMYGGPRRRLNDAEWDVFDALTYGLRCALALELVQGEAHPFA